ncbi:bifunctional 2-polyprenyl-6-hydroxyphenol methylase/3-demethylubiquinol 3-O-methyltransferase UbiG [Polynucleobacter sp. P1-05-14]|uniref:class I SAM-dependent methyltransferase n=1 Tax=Polynucleobacter sp. P1-05-14 TaxID=1819732 RepID=UPI001C0CC6BF|nr:class I SAM-dependent methyltransferase [Polynucleobacter sp. P1-05-14]MBU3547849.1 class I SAM-dependent methyltransferase [Polynucleobacter sp. P1-05-14]
MTMQVLQNEKQILTARHELEKKGASCLESRLLPFLRKYKLVGGVTLGDFLKSWDVLKTLEFIESNIQKGEPIIDFGSYASEILVALHKMGYSNLTGADLNPNLKKMPHQGAIKYEITNFLKTKFADNSFKAITSISVIEHGFNAAALLSEVSRLLQPGGYFIASFDYWPQKIDTTGITFFDMEWNIFSENEIIDFVEQAKSYGLTAEGEMSYSGQDAPIECGGKSYTFGWLVLKKK